MDLILIIIIISLLYFCSECMLDTKQCECGQWKLVINVTECGNACFEEDCQDETYRSYKCEECEKIICEDCNRWCYQCGVDVCDDCWDGGQT